MDLAFAKVWKNPDGRIEVNIWGKPGLQKSFSFNNDYFRALEIEYLFNKIIDHGVYLIVTVEKNLQTLQVSLYQTSKVEGIFKDRLIVGEYLYESNVRESS